MPNLNKKSNKTAKILTLILMILSLNTIYQLPYLMYYYYTPLQEAMGLVGRDADYGRLLNVYGIANVILYLPGGWIADKFDAKKLMVISMVGTGVLGLWESTFPSYATLQLIFVLFAITTVLTYWSSSIKCINLIADSGEQGGMFGSLEAGRSVCGLLVTTLFVTIFTALSGRGSDVAMSTIIRTCGIIMIVVGILLAVLMPEPKNVNSTNKTLVESIKAMGGAFKLPATYLLAGMIFCGSLIGAASSYYAPYLQKVCGMSTSITVPFTSYRAVICGLIGASAAALMATKFGRSSKPIIGAGVILVAGFAIMVLLPGSAAFMWPLLIIMILLSMCHSVFRALYYATIDEAGTPKNMVGSVVGIASLLGFLPDTFYSSMCGGWIEQYGTDAFKMIFGTCIAAAVLGLVCAFISDRMIVKHRAAAAAEK